MSEDNDLAMSGLSNQAFSYGLPVHVVERGNGIVKDDARLVFGGGEFGHERGQRNAAMFALTQDLPHRGRGLPSKCDLEARNALSAVLLPKFHSEVSNLECKRPPTSPSLSF